MYSLAIVLSVGLGCGGGEELNGCSPVCTDAQLCHLDTGLCIDRVSAVLGSADIAENFDATMVGERVYVAIYDRVYDRYLIGERDSGQSLFSWQTVFLGAGIEPGVSPALSLLVRNEAPLLVAQSGESEVVAIHPGATGWVITSLAVLEQPVAYLDAVRVGAQSVHVVTASPSGELTFLSTEEPRGLPVPVVADQLGTVRAPAVLVRLAGRTSIFAALAPAGLATLSRVNDSEWSGNLLDEHAVPLSLDVLQTSQGLLTTFHDGATGGIRLVIGADDEVTVEDLVSSILPAEKTAIAGSLKLSLARGIDESSAYLAYYDFSGKATLLLRMDSPYDWSPVVSLPSVETLVPALVAQPGLPPIGLAIQLSSMGTGSFLELDLFDGP